ncbi:MAG: YkgJ family cysteine cluster protein [candidate division Zixibacteria bacterium]|nr:YkgJ family cysteine cluster protein [candidate division Zixibacteria bacterium]
MDAIFIDYRDVVTLVEAEFDRNMRLYEDRIQCGRGCSSCCSQMFRITLLDAARISEVVRQLPEPERRHLQNKARVYLQERQHLLHTRNDEESHDHPSAMGLRLPCPALEEGVCGIYEARPVVCRKWGIPLFDPYHPDALQACELNFPPGTEFEDKELDLLIERQTEISERWQTLKAAVNERLCPEKQATTIAEAILYDYDDMIRQERQSPCPLT